MPIVLAWETFKDRLSSVTHITHHGLHLILGLLLTVVIGRALGKPRTSWVPPAIVLCLELINEASDFTRYYVSNWPWTPYETLLDIIITMGPPILLVLVARWRSAGDP